MTYRDNRLTPYPEHHSVAKTADRVPPTKAKLEAMAQAMDEKAKAEAEEHLLTAIWHLRRVADPDAHISTPTRRKAANCVFIASEAVALLESKRRGR